MIATLRDARERLKTPEARGFLHLEEALKFMDTQDTLGEDDINAILVTMEKVQDARPLALRVLSKKFEILSMPVSFAQSLARAHLTLNDKLAAQAIKVLAASGLPQGSVAQDMMDILLSNQSSVLAMLPTVIEYLTGVAKSGALEGGSALIVLHRFTGAIGELYESAPDEATQQAVLGMFSVLKAAEERYGRTVESCYQYLAVLEIQGINAKIDELKSED